jgi:hypothetical protein
MLRPGKNPHASLYASKAFRALRLSIIARDKGKCRMCAAIVTDGRKAPNAAVIDHMQPHNGDLARFWDRDNMWLVCKRCHDGPCQAYERKGGDVRSAKMSHKVVGLDGYPVTGGGSNP